MPSRSELRSAARSIRLVGRIARSLGEFVVGSPSAAPAYLRTRRGSNQPIFIAGCGHTGTTLVRAILGSHSAVRGVSYESELFVSRHASPGLERTSELMRRRPLAQLVTWQAEAEAEGKQRFVEKTPRHVHSVGFIRRLLPRAPIVLLTRDPLDVVASIIRRGSSPADAIDRWMGDTRATLAACRMPNVLLVRYEELVAHPDRTVAAICEFCGLDHDPATLEYYLVEQSHGHETTATGDHAEHVELRRGQINSPLFDGRGSWTKTLDESAAADIRDATSSMQAQVLAHTAEPIEQRAGHRATPTRPRHRRPRTRSRR